MKQKLFLSVSLCCMLTIVNFAQFSTTKQRTIGGSSSDVLTSLQVTSDGGYILGGSSVSNSSWEKTENGRGREDYWVVKLDAAANIQWDKTIGGSDDDYLASIQQTADGGYILGGQSYSDISGEKTENSRGARYPDYWVVKLDATGNVQWDKTIGGRYVDALEYLQQTTDGGYILGGHSNSNISVDKTEDSKGSYDYWIVKLDTAGSIQWDKTIGGSGSENFFSLQQTTDGGYILGGSSQSNISGDKTEDNRGDFDYWIVKIDMAGNIQWDKTIGGSSNDYFVSLQQTSDGGYILGGSSPSGISGEKSQRSRGGFDYWIVKVDTAGNIQWDKTIGGSEDDDFTSLQQTLDGGYILGGSSRSDISWEKTENSRGEFDYWIVKVDNQGRLQMDKTVGGDANDNLECLKEVKKNHFILGGTSYSGISGEKTQRIRGNNSAQDYWVVELSYKKIPVTDTVITAANRNSIVLADKQLISIYPNPAKDILHIQATGKSVYTLTNNAGVTVLTQTISGNGEMNISRLEAGVYYLKNNSTGEVTKIIIR